MARPQVPRWLGRDAERVSHPPERQAPPPRSAAIRREVCSALHIFSAPYLDTGATRRMRAHTHKHRAEEHLGRIWHGLLR